MVQERKKIIDAGGEAHGKEERGSDGKNHSDRAETIIPGSMPGGDPLRAFLESLSRKNEDGPSISVESLGGAFRLTPLRMAAPVAFGIRKIESRKRSIDEQFLEDTVIQKIVQTLKNEYGIALESLLTHAGFFLVPVPDTVPEDFVRGLFYRLVETLLMNLIYYLELDTARLESLQRRSREASLVAEYAIGKAADLRKTAIEDSGGIESNYIQSIHYTVQGFAELNQQISTLKKELSAAVDLVKIEEAFNSILLRKFLQLTIK